MTNSKTIDELIARLGKLQYYAQGHALMGDPVPQDLQHEYDELVKELEKLQSKSAPAAAVPVVYLPPATGPAQNLGGGVTYTPWEKGYILKNPQTGEVQIHNTADNNFKIFSNGKLVSERRTTDQ